MNLSDIGLDTGQDLSWQDLATCRNHNPQMWDSWYVKKIEQRELTDSICLSCPVLAECGMAGIAGKETGVWGGIYMDNGKPVPELNEHKTEEFKQKLAERIYERD